MPPEDPAYNPAGQPKSWLYFALWFSVLATLATAGIVLLSQFFASRPVDLVNQTTELAEIVRATLESNRIPDDAITEADPEVRQSAAGGWAHHDFTVDTPVAVDPQGVKAALRRALLPYNVSMSEAGTEGNLVLDFTVGDYDFATVRFFITQPPPRQAVDFRDSVSRVIGEVERILLAEGVSPASLRKSPETEMLDDEARWLFSTMAFPLPETLTPGELRGKIEESLAARDVRVETSPGPFGTSLITVTFAGKRCLELSCESVGAAAASPGVAMPSDTAQPANPPVSDATMPLPVPGPPMPETGPPAPEPASEPTPLPMEDALPMDRLIEGEPEAPGPRETPAPAPAAPRLAIILDDGGYGGDHSDLLLDTLDPALTLAILPNTPYAADTATRGAARGFEIMLHMPMETHGDGANPFPGEITTSMTPEAIQTATRAAIAQIPGLKGINNHTGSKFTADAEAMRSCLAVVKELGLFFVDSRTIGNSKAYDVAREMGIPTARRDVFLDNEKDHGYIRKQLDELVSIAKSRGSAIGIGHFRPDSVAVLVDYLPTLAEQGVTLVHVSELLQ